MQTLHGKLKLIGGKDLKIWLDTEQLQVDSESLKHNVQQSLALLVFLSEGFLTTEFCLTELRTAYKAGIPIIVVCDDGITKDMLDDEIKQFEAAKGGDPQEEDKATLDAMVELRQRVLDQWHSEQKGPNNHAVPFSIEQENSTPGGGEILGPVLWWSRPFVRVALKGVFQQLLVCTPWSGSPLKQAQRSDDPRPKLLFHDELLDLRKMHEMQVSLFVSPSYPSDRYDELKQAFEKAGNNLGVRVSISSSRNDTADQHSVLLLCPGIFRTKELKHLLIRETKRKGGLKTPVPFLLYSTDMSADVSEYRQEGTRILGRLATQVFTPMWSAWPEVSSLQTVAAEEQLRALSRATKGTPDRASSEIVAEHDQTQERWKQLSSSVKVANSLTDTAGQAGSRVGVQYVPEP